MVLPDGRLIRTGSQCLKDVTGYNLAGLFVGSEGTLGVITEVTVKIHPAPATTAYLGVRFTSLEAGLDAIRTFIQAGLRPSVPRLYDVLDPFPVGRGYSPLPLPVHA